METLDVETISLIQLFLYGIAGIALSLYFDFVSSGADHRSFDPKYWIKDNLQRIINSIIAIVLVIFFGDDLGIPIESGFGMMMLGINADKIFESIKDRRKVKKKEKESSEDLNKSETL